jgi:hypothetical protein
MPVAQSPAHYINSSKGCPSITESFPLCCLLLHKMSLSPLSRHCQWQFAIEIIGVFSHLEARVRVGRRIPHSKDSLSLFVVQYFKDTLVEK